MTENSKKNEMATSTTSEQHIEVEGVVIFDTRGCFKVELDSGQTINAKPSGEIRKNKIQIIINDRVLVKCSIYDLTNGFIVRRLSSGKKPKHVDEDNASSNKTKPGDGTNHQQKKKSFDKKQKIWK